MGWWILTSASLYFGLLWALSEIYPLLGTLTSMALGAMLAYHLIATR